MEAGIVLLDNGHPNLEKSLESLINQTVRVPITFVGGPKTNYEVAESLLSDKDKIIRNVKGIWNARVIGICKTNAKNIISCDSDTVYFPDYVENAIKALNKYYWIKAGTLILKKKADNVIDRVRQIFEVNFMSLSFNPLVHDHTLAFRRESFLKLLRYNRYNPLKWILMDRCDTSSVVIWNLVPVKKVKEMKAIVEYPTYYTRIISSGKVWKVLRIFEKEG